MRRAPTALTAARAGTTRASSTRVAGLLVAGALAVGCGSDDDAGAGGRTGAVTVFAAASLTDAFTELADAFEQADPGVDVTLSFGASSDLVRQITEGAPADVFASADQRTMATLVDAGAAGDEPAVFATNALEIVVGPGNPKGVTGVADLAGGDLVVVTCAVEVPCGAYAQQLFENAGVTVTPASYEENVRAVLTKVRLGEADAGIVYRTDVAAAGDDADGVEIPADVNVVAEYPIVVTRDAADPAAARAFVDFVRSDAGQAVLASYGFASP